MTAETLLTTLVVAFGTVVLSGSSVAAGSNSHPSTTCSRHSAEVVRVYSHGFDWADAAIGSAAGIGLSSIAAGAFAVATGGRVIPKETEGRTWE